MTFCSIATRIVVGFDLSFLSTSTHNASRLRTVPKTAMTLEMYPPNKKWLAGSIIFTFTAFMLPLQCFIPNKMLPAGSMMFTFQYLLSPQYLGTQLKNVTLG